MWSTRICGSADLIPLRVQDAARDGRAGKRCRGAIHHLSLSNPLDLQPPLRLPSETKYRGRNLSRWRTTITTATRIHTSNIKISTRRMINIHKTPIPILTPARHHSTPLTTHTTITATRMNNNHTILKSQSTTPAQTRSMRIPLPTRIILGRCWNGSAKGGKT